MGQIFTTIGVEIEMASVLYVCTKIFFLLLGVGKTSLVVRYIGKMFSHHISPTIGASFFTCNINIEDTRVKLQV